MATTKTTKPAKDGTGTAYTQGMATEATGADLTPFFYVAEPAGETLIAPATSTKQPALGTAGTASADVITVQGIASMTAVKVDGSGVTQPVSGTVTANIGTAGTLSTAANQTSQITQETASATALGTPADVAWVSGSGSAIALLKKIAGGTPTTIADGADVTQGSLADAAWSGSGSSSVVAALKAIYAKVAGIIGVSQSGTWTVQPGNTANTTAWKVDGSAVTQPVSGTVTANLNTIAGVATAAKQPALGIAGTASSDVITVQGIAGAVAQPVTGTFFQATQPVSAAALPLPALAATSTKQPALGTAGSASADVITVQGIASGTALAASQSGAWNISLLSGANAIGAVIGRSTMTVVTPTVTSNGAYAAGNEVGGLMTFAVGGNGSGGELRHICVTSKTPALTTALTAFVFALNPAATTWTDKSSPAINTADIGKLLCSVEMNIPTSGLGTMTAWNATDIGAQFSAANLYVILIASSAMTLTSTSTSDITCEIGMRVD